MKEIKTNYKVCPSCGNKINWRKVTKKRFPTIEEAKLMATQLNESKEQINLTAKELLEKGRRLR
jgi:hypothetical protein